MPRSAAPRRGSARAGGRLGPHRTLILWMLSWIALGAGCDDGGATDPAPDAGRQDVGPARPDLGAPDGGDGGCEPGETRPCEAECPGAFARCVGGEWGGCERPPERCDGEDNDCDGLTDEIFPTLGDVCEAGVGACAAEGQIVCDGPESVRCDVAVGRPEAETCDGVDNDCDGATDEESVDAGGVCEAGVGACAAEGALRCVDAALRCEAEAGAPEAETCDGVDNDCDGATDEESADAGGACIEGLGRCAAAGQLRCEAGALRCDAVASEPSDELCNGVDDDCDGAADEGFALVGQLCFIGVGACGASGQWVCGPDGVERCSATPGAGGPEACNGVDDDCDGITDEADPALGAACAVGVGACERPGSVICEAGALGCAGEIGAPGLESCNGVDDDCDGATDEVYPDLGDRCVVGVGACASAGLIACSEGGARCDARPGAPRLELCNGIDDDCDGDTDENFPILGEACEVGRGQCRAEGRFVCERLGVTCSATAGAPGDELCNGADDDCDGAADEGFPGLDAPCTVGVGACQRDGVGICAPGGEAAACSVEAGAPAEELCNGVDDDCDGATDEGFPDLGAPCVAGVGVCAVGGVWQCSPEGDARRCEPSAAAPAPSEERCSGQDEDCDGRTDEGFPPAGGPCAVGIGACAEAGRWACSETGDAAVCSATAGEPSDELCNGVDDDCDGAADEGFPGLDEPCTVGVGRCAQAGRAVCDPSGQGTICDAEAAEPSGEICNGVDDDCDGVTDEAWPTMGEACAVGVGACLRLGEVACFGAEGPRCGVSPGAPTVEACDGEDDDCDGQVDEHLPALGAPCAAGLGACAAPGVWRCGAEGLMICDGAPEAPTEELCDGEDNDCDGASDEGCCVGECPDLCADDAHEPDDSPAEAAPIELGAVQRAALCGDGEDWRVLQVRAGVDYRIQATAQEPGAVMLEVYDAEGQPLAVDQGSGPGGQALIRPLRAQADGAWLIRLVAVAAPSPALVYELHVGLDCADDRYEPDDLAPGDVELTVDDAQLHTLCGGPDLVAFEAEAGTLYQLDAEDLHGGADPYLELYDPSGTLIRVDRDSGRRLAARLWWVAAQTGRYQVRVLDRPASAGPDGARYGGQRTYSLRLSAPAWPGCVSDPTCPEGAICLEGQCVPLDACTPDLDEDDDSLAQAVALRRGQVSVSQHCEADEDWRRFQATAGERLDVQVYGVRAPRQIRAELFELAGGVVIAELPATADGAALQGWIAPATGQYAVRIREVAPSPSGDVGYRLTVRAACPEDAREPDSAPWLAQPLAQDGRPVVAQLCQEDWYRFEAEDGEGFAVVLAGGPAVAEIRGRDGGATEMARVVASGPFQSEIRWAAPVAGTYYIKVRAVDHLYGGSGAYTIALLSFPVDPRCASLCATKHSRCNDRPYADGGPSPAREAASEGATARWWAQGGWHRARRMAGWWAVTLPPGADPEKVEGVVDTHPTGALAHRGVHLVRIEDPPAGAQPVYLDDAGRPMLLNGRLAARIDPRVQPGGAQASQIAGAFGLKLIGPLSGLDGIWIFEGPEGSDALQLAEAVMASGVARWAHPDFYPLTATHAGPSDPLYPTQWHLGHDPGAQAETEAVPGLDIRADRAWPLLAGAEPVRLAVFDEGFDLRHPDLPYLEDPARPGQPWTVNAPADPEALIPAGLAAHGTSVAGVAAARHDNEIGVAGLCPTCEIIPAFGATSVSIVELAEIFIALREAEAAVINNSWGIVPGRISIVDPEDVSGSPVSLPLADSLAEAIESAATESRGGRGAVVVFSAGNGNEPVDLDPFSSADGVIVVAAIADDGRKAPYSNFGDRVWISAPSSGGQTTGVITTDVLGLWGYSAGDYTDSFGGTSAAAPLVAGAAGAMLSVAPTLTAAQVKDLLRRTARPIDPIGGRWRSDGEGRRWSPIYGYGMLDVEAAVAAALVGCAPEIADRCVPLGDQCPDGQPGLFSGGCDGEGAPLPLCAPCALDPRCPGLCAAVPGEARPLCLSPCDGDPASCDGACVEGVCLAAACRQPAPEVCDGDDDDLDGHVDEGACPLVALGEVCESDRACVEGALCVIERGDERRCRAQCGPQRPCAGQGEACVTAVDRYGVERDRRICWPLRGDHEDCLSACYQAQLRGPDPARAVDALAICVDQAVSCRQTEQCF